MRVLSISKMIHPGVRFMSTDGSDKYLVLKKTSELIEVEVLKHSYFPVGMEIGFFYYSDAWLANYLLVESQEIRLEDLI